MCGICGVFRPTRNGTWDECNLDGMIDVMAHRGPDDRGLYTDERIALGHRRLSIIDLGSGRQPMSNEDGTVWIVFNGEIYNHLELRRELKARGHRYKTNSDTESIIHSYEEHGIECLKELEGMFAFALWDTRKEQLFLARDRLGKKPLYYTQVKGHFIFGSEIKSILQNLLCERELDEESLYHYLTFVFTPPPRTLFKGIFKLSPGHYAVLEKPVDEVKEYPFWNPLENFEETRGGVNQEEAAQTIIKYLKRAIKDRMISDVPFGVFLSGGVDSSANVALMSQLMTRPVQTFSIGYKNDEKFNELEYARKIAKIFKTEHREIIIDESDLTEEIHGIIYNQDEPIADPVCLPLYFVSKLARENGVIVVQIGEGSDEIFCGYPRYMKLLRLALLNRNIFQQFPLQARKFLYRMISSAFRRLHRTKELEYLRRGTYGQEIFWGGATAFGEYDKAQLLTGSYREEFGSIDSYHILEQYYNELYERIADLDELDKIIYIDLCLRLPELLLMRVDKMCMATSVEARTPFLDHRLVEYALAIPRAIKIKDGQTKYILKKALQGIIPDEIIFRKKQGFDVPISRWLKGKNKDFIRDTIIQSRIKHRGIFDYEFVEMILSAHDTGKRDYSFLIWNLFNLSLWYDTWIDSN